MDRCTVRELLCLSIKSDPLWKVRTELLKHRDHLDQEFLTEMLCHGILRDPEGQFCDAIVTFSASRAPLDGRYGDSKRTALHYCAIRGATGAAARLLDRRASLDLADVRGRTPLSLAAEKGYGDLCSLLLMRRALVNHQDKKGRTAVHWSSQFGQLCCLKLLCQAAADVSLRDVDQRSPLFVAEGPGDGADCAQWLLKEGAQADDRDVNAQTPLFESLLRADEAKVSVLLAAKAEVNCADRLDHTPLCVVASKGHLKLCDQLLEARAEVTHGPAGRTPSSVAERLKQPAVLERLATARREEPKKRSYKLVVRTKKGIEIEAGSPEYEEAYNKMVKLMQELGLDAVA